MHHSSLFIILIVIVVRVTGKGCCALLLGPCRDTYYAASGNADAEASDPDAKIYSH